MSKVQHEYYQDQNGFMKGQTKKNRAVGFCHSSKHRGFLSVKNMKRHDCIGKQCPMFEKYENAPYWQEKRRRKADKKATKEKQDKQLENFAEVVKRNINRPIYGTLIETDKADVIGTIIQD